MKRFSQFCQDSIITGIRWYIRYIKPVTHMIIQTSFGSVSTCRHSPSCSQFTIQAIRTHGTIRGLILGGKRIILCTSL